MTRRLSAEMLSTGLTVEELSDTLQVLTVLHTREQDAPSTAASTDR
jgi:hypothetical protein